MNFFMNICVNSIEFRTSTDGLIFPVFTGSRSNNINRKGRGLGIENKTGFQEAKIEQRRKKAS